MESEELTRNQKYYRENLEREKQRSREWYHENKDGFDKDKKKDYLSEYYKNNKSKYKRKPEDVARINARKREKYAQEPETRKYYRDNAKQWQSDNPDKRKAQRIKKYNITFDEFNALLDAQNGGCAICRYSDRSDPKFFPVVDHCHATGIVRGLLCANCNHAIGKFKDNPALLRDAAQYLENSHAER